MGYTIDGPTKVITLTAGTTSVSVRDLWSRWVDWFLTRDNSKYLPAFEFVGGNDIDESQGTYIPIYAFLMNGWKIKPQEANHTLSIIDGILLVNGGGDPFNNTIGAYVVRINYQQPVQAISFSTEGGTPGDAPTVEEIRQEIDTNSTQLIAIRERTDNLPDVPVDVSDLTTAPTVEQIRQEIDLNSVTLAQILALVDATDDRVILIQKITSNKVTKAGDVITIYEDNGITIWRRYNLASGGRVQV